jgi:D-amino-acid dehydrogenase
MFDAVVICAGVASHKFGRKLGDRINIYPVKGYSITVPLSDSVAQQKAPMASLLDDEAKIVTSRLGRDRFRVAGTAEIAGQNLDIVDARIKPLTQWVEYNFPELPSKDIKPWAGLRPMRPNMIPLVAKGRKPNIFYNTGHGHLGWTLACYTANMVGELINATNA